MYTVECKNCGTKYYSDVNRSGLCANCKKTVRGRTNTRYRDNTYDRLTFYIPKGDKDNLKKLAASREMSVNMLLTTALNHYKNLVYFAAKHKLDLDELINTISELLEEKYKNEDKEK